MFKRIILSLAFAFVGVLALSPSVFAEGAAMKVSPIMNYFTIKAGDIQNYNLTITNSGTEAFKYKLYASSYSVLDEDYTFEFTDSGSPYNQITRWISFQNEDGTFNNYSTFSIGPGEEQTVVYRVTVPDSIPEGSQFCVIFAETIPESKENTATGIEAVTRVAVNVIGHGLGVTNENASIKDFSLTHPFTNKSIVASALVENSGNTDFEAVYNFKVSSIFGKLLYENSPSFTVLPETERRFSTTWEEAPAFGVFRVTFSVSASDSYREETHIVFIVPIFILIIMLLLLTIIVIWIIISIRKRKERSSRLVI